VAGTTGTPVSPLVSMLGLPAEAAIDVMNDDNAEHYFAHSDQFHMALDLTAGRRGLVALGDVLQRWTAHLLSAEADVEPLTEMREVNLTGTLGSMPMRRGLETRCGPAKSSMTRPRRALSASSG